MAKIFYFDAQLGHNSRTGLTPFDARRDADGFNILTLEPGDRVLFRAGHTFEGNFVLSRSGATGKEIVIDTYTMGGEATRWASFKADADSTRPIAWDVNASYIRMAHLQAVGARYAGFVFREKQAHITGEHLRMRDCGMGARLRGSHIHLTYADVQGATMSRFQRKVTDEGGVAFSVEADGWLNTDNIIEQAFVYGAVAAGEEKIDGGGVEIFGDVDGLIVDGCTFLFTKGGIEVGGPSRTATQVPSRTRNVTFRQNLFIHCGILALFNDPSKDFPIRVTGMEFDHNTIYDRTRTLSQVYLQGNWGNDLSGTLRFDGNLYDGLGSWIGASDKNTDLNTIPHIGNAYHRATTGGLGYMIEKSESVGHHALMNEAGFDFRLAPSYVGNGAYDGLPGALGVGMTYASAIDLKWLLKQTRTPLDANNFVGGLHSYPSHKQMWAIPKELRRAGMACVVSDYDQKWRLDGDMNTWWQEM